MSEKRGASSDALNRLRRQARSNRFPKATSMILQRCGNRYYPAVLMTQQDGAPKLYTDVLYDYEAQKDEELTIRAGDEVAVLKTDSFNGWLLCSLHGRAGAVNRILLS